MLLSILTSVMFSKHFFFIFSMQILTALPWELQLQPIHSARLAKQKLTSHLHTVGPGQARPKLIAFTQSQAGLSGGYKREVGRRQIAAVAAKETMGLGVEAGFWRQSLN